MGSRLITLEFKNVPGSVGVEFQNDSPNSHRSDHI